MIGAHQFELFARADARENADVEQRAALAAGHLRDLRAFDDIGGGVAEADGAADAARGHRVIAGDHDHADAGLPAVLDGVRHVGARRILQPDEADEGQAVIGVRVGLRACLHGAGQHAQAVMAEMLDAGEPFTAHVVVERHLAVFGDYFAGGGQHRFRRALDRDQKPLAAPVHGRHHLAGGVEGVLVHDRAALQQRRALEPGAEAGTQQRQLHGIAAAFLVGAV